MYLFSFPFHSNQNYEAKKGRKTFLPSECTRAMAMVGSPYFTS